MGQAHNLPRPVSDTHSSNNSHKGQINRSCGFYNPAGQYLMYKSPEMNMNLHENISFNNIFQGEKINDHINKISNNSQKVSEYNMANLGQEIQSKNQKAYNQYSHGVLKDNSSNLLQKSHRGPKLHKEKAYHEDDNQRIGAFQNGLP